MGTDSVFSYLSLQFSQPIATASREKLFSTQRSRKESPLVYDSLSEEYGSVSDKESPPEEDALASEAQETTDDSGEEYDHDPQESRVKSSHKPVVHEPIWNEQDCDGHQVEPRSRGSWEWGEIIPRPFKSSRELWFEKNAGRITEKSQQLEKRISSCNRRRMYAGVLVLWEVTEKDSSFFISRSFEM